MNRWSTLWLILRNGVEKYLVKNFHIFVPSSAGNFKLLGFHTKISIITIFPLLSRLLQILDFKVKIIKSKLFCTQRKKIKESVLLKKYFNEYGSDKSSIHNYHYIYSSLFKDNNKVTKVLEIGLGTDDEKMISNMGKYGKPGASVRAFREFFKAAKIYGADIDKKILFTEMRIKTFYVDQTSNNSLKNLFKRTGKNFDLIIDDGLHAPYTNINVIISSLKYLKKNGWIVIEDIPFKAKPIWEVISFIVSQKHECKLIEAKLSYVFLINKK
ncbi:class I SAM-dependent methyltransferase [Candidatus Pelagibacter sp.]|nr:class I SAM-dependent methyltransferase [Candidatus Pelagibacter sp.]